MALNKRQKIAVELLTNGEGLTLKQVAERAEINEKTLYNWRNLPQYAEFQAEIERINNERWKAAEDAARAAAIRLCKEGRADIVKFVLQNCGYNPSTKVEAEINNDIVINIED